MPTVRVLLICLAALLAPTQAARDASKPNIVIILIDDMGFNDVSFHGSNQVLTPNIDALAYNGIILNRNYVPNLCTPSRATLLTGKFPIHTGTQHYVIINDEPWGLPLDQRLMPEYFRDAGYSTNLVGKWHLGFARKEHTPVMRGFDHHYGYYSGYIDYYDHTLDMMKPNMSSGLDFRRDLQPWPQANGSYATDVFTDEAVRIISGHNKRKPLFLVMSHLAVHTGNTDDPMQAPLEYVERFEHISDPKRRTYAAMMAKLDESVATTMKALAARNMLDNSIVLLYSDNGAPTQGIHSNAGSNFPFRGQKETPWDGGLRTAGLLWSPLLQQRNYVSEQVVHAVDWLPTLASAAGVRLPSTTQLDGLNMWPSLSQRLAPQPRQLVHAADEVFDYHAYMNGDWKLVNGTRWEGQYDTWLGDLDALEEDPLAENYAEEVLASPVHGILDDGRLDVAAVHKLRSLATVRCPADERDGDDPVYACRPLESACLFNLAEDPCERYNLAAVQPQRLRQLAGELNEQRATAVPSARVPFADPRANPALHGGVWQWWVTGNVGIPLRSSIAVFLCCLWAIWGVRRVFTWPV